MVANRLLEIQFPYYQRNAKVKANGSGLSAVEVFSELLAADMIDEFWIQVTPVLLGKGKRLFVPSDYEQRLELIESTQMGEMIELHYKRK